MVFNGSGAISTRCAHRGNPFDIDQGFPVEVARSFEHAVFLDEQLDQRNRLLRAVRVDLRHGHVVEKDRQSRACRWAVGVLRSFLQLTLDGSLHIDGLRTRGEIELQAGETAKVGSNGRGFTRTSVADEKHRLMNV